MIDENRNKHCNKHMQEYNCGIIGKIIIIVLMLTLIGGVSSTVFSTCYNTIYGCRECDDSIGYKVCTSCLDGYYLMTNTTNSGTNLSFCVPDCALANPRYINNPDTMKCIDCGEGCTACNMYTGCEICSGMDQQNAFLYDFTPHPIGLPTTFRKCQKCFKMANKDMCKTCTAANAGDSNCLTCAFWISDTDCAAGNCIKNGGACDYLCTDANGFQTCVCGTSRFLNQNSCSSCTLQNCMICDSISCYKCSRGYTDVYTGSSITSCSMCTSNSIFAKDCASCAASTTDGVQLIRCSMCDSSLVLDQFDCKTFCPRGSYIYSETLEDNGMYNNNVCKTCDINCYECASEGTNGCLSCNKGSFLTLTSSGSVSGTCSSISTNTLELNIFVKAVYIETAGDGTYENPFGNIVKALNYVEEQSSSNSGSTANIYLLKGDHFMTRNFAHYSYQKSKTSQYSYNYSINIQPAFCGQTLGLHSFGSSDNDCITVKAFVVTSSCNVRNFGH